MTYAIQMDNIVSTYAKNAADVDIYENNVLVSGATIPYDQSEMPSRDYWIGRRSILRDSEGDIDYVLEQKLYQQCVSFLRSNGVKFT